MPSIASIPIGSWVTKQRELLAIKEMSDAHIRNVLAMLQRQAEAEDACDCSYYTSSAGECSHGAFSQEMLWRDPVFMALEAELDQRARFAAAGVKP